ncbi:hypothetical protein MKX03_005775 [Papaver bracteatum]|nr:hypothetical protein MKX03_005775 [Papaver bracteatum]
MEVGPTLNPPGQRVPKFLGPGVTIMVVSWLITLYTLWQMVEMHEVGDGRLGVDIVYMVTGGRSLKKVHDLVCDESCKNIKLTYFIMIFASCHFFLAQLPNFNSISIVSLAAAVMSLSYSTIAWAASVKKGVQLDAEYTYRASTQTGKFCNFFMLEIQATIPSTPEKPSKGPMCCCCIHCCCHMLLPCGFHRLLRFRKQDDILESLEKPVWLIVNANMFVVIHVIGSHQIYAMPVFDMMKTLVKKLHFTPGLPLRLIARTFYVAFTMFVAICFPFFGGLLGFFGGLAFAPATYFVRAMIFLLYIDSFCLNLTSHNRT